MILETNIKYKVLRDFPSDPVVKTPLCNAGDTGLIPGWRAKIPYASEQQPPHSQLLKPVCSGAHATQLVSRRTATKEPACCN